MVAIVNADIYTPDVVVDGGGVLIEKGVIAAVGHIDIPARARTIDAQGMCVAPGFVDVHTHGLHGYNVMGPELAETIPLLPRYGVTAFVPTTLTAPMDDTLIALSEMADVLSDPPAGAQPLGIHIEGPHLSPHQRGMHDVDLLHPLIWDEFEDFQRAAQGHICMVTFAPEETDAGPTLISQLTAAGIIPVIGHSDATFAQVTEYVAAGLVHATHTYNAMRGFHHREPGVLGAVWYYDQIIGQLIADGHHVHPAAMSLLLRIKGADGVCLISDAAPIAGLPPGEYEWGGAEVVVDGDCRFPDGTLAGAAVLLDTGVRTLVNQVGIGLRDALVTATQVPADIIGLLPHGLKKGRLRPGWDADVVVLDEDLEVQLTLVGGQIRYAAAPFSGLL